MPYPIVDTHVHWWDPAGVPLRWLGETPALDRPFLPPDLADAAEGCALDRIVFVECDAAPGRHLDEARWVSGLAAEEPLLGAIVAMAPVERGAAVIPDLEALAALPLVRGVRRLLQGEADAAFCLRPGFVAGVQLLPRHGLHFELCVFHRQLGAAVELVRRCPEVRFILDHIGKPAIRAGRLDPWRAEIDELAQLPNVVCKLSGLVTEADHAAWTEADLAPYVAHVLAAFGPARLMFGSDWPVATLACPYRRWLEVLDSALAGLTEVDRRRIFHDNAMEWYRIEPTIG